LLATDLAAEDEKGYANNKTLLYAPTMIVTIGPDRYSRYVISTLTESVYLCDR
jgi:hypothetical protein